MSIIELGDLQGKSQAPDGSVVQEPPKREEVRVEQPAELDERGKTLLRAAEIIRMGGLCRGVWEKDGAHCLVGAYWKAKYGGWEKRPKDENLYEVGKIVGIKSPHVWNDALGRTAEEVAEALERAAYFG